jgi:hypothetical protein
MTYETLLSVEGGVFSILKLAQRTTAMAIWQHANVTARQATPHPSFRRYIALLDVLGIRSWLQKETARTIAERLDEALVACEPSSSGVTAEGTSYGPLMGVTHFSDSLLVWSPDDSWASFYAICNALKMIVAVALLNGVPLRGSVAVGECVCLPQKLRFVGQPIVEAYLWSERQRPYKSVGVDLTPEAITSLRKKLVVDPIPAWWAEDVSPPVINGKQQSSNLLTWFKNCLFVNHWGHGIFTGGDPRKMFLSRKLPVPPDEEKSVEDKLMQMLDFFNRTRSSYAPLDRMTNLQDIFNAQQREFVRLNELKASRDRGGEL